MSIQVENLSFSYGSREILSSVSFGADYGEFLSEPYEDSDWAGTSKTRRYVDISIRRPSDPDTPCVSIERLEEILPEIEWRRGHSGQLLTKEQERQLWGNLQL